ncbi:MAG: hypothetical protein JNK87_18125 [Bryobacterales bacterium]|nr:hypothetical protein [Bryobacterales bacterium]
MTTSTTPPADSRGGGSATQAGTTYQNRFAAWTAVHILAEQDASAPWNLPVSVTLETLQAEAHSAIDDLVVGTSAGGRIASQAKHAALSLSTAEDSDLAKTIEQFVSEYASNSKADPSKDRYVLVTTSRSSAPIKTHLVAFLTRMRTSPNPTAEWTTGNQQEQHAATVLRDHVVRKWINVYQKPPDDSDIQALLRLVYVQILDVDQGEHDEVDAKNLLRQRILRDPIGADGAWATLIAEMGDFAARHQRADRNAIQDVLIKAGFDLQAPRSYRSDVKRLKEISDTTFSTLEQFSQVRIGTSTVRVQRSVVDDIRKEARDGNLLILGVPGAGKSGALFDFAEGLRSSAADLFLVAVDQLEAPSLGMLRVELGVDHDLVEVLRNWPGTEPGYLIIDALDAARTNAAIRTLALLIEQVIGLRSRWRVVATVRKYDLRYNVSLRKLFQGMPNSAFRDNEFHATRHVSVSTLSADELTQVHAQSIELGELITNAPAPLQDLLSVPFNLRLLAELLTVGLTASELRPVETQVELLDRYWQERILGHDSDGDSREVVLRRTIHSMVQQRSLRCQRSAATSNDSSSGQFLLQLLRTHVLAEWDTQTGTTRRDFLTFPHHLLFDYAVARLYFSPEQEEMIAGLSGEPDLFIAIRPSIELYYQRLWREDRTDFWQLTFRSLAANIPEVGKLIGPSVFALRATDLNDTQPVLAAFKNAAQRDLVLALLQHVFATLATHASSSDVATSSPWIAFLDAVSSPLTFDIVNPTRQYALLLAKQIGTLDDQSRKHFGHFSRRALSFALRDGIPLLAVNAIDWIMKTIDTDPVLSLALLRECISAEHLRTWGFKILPALSKHAATLVALDQTLVRDLYIAAFSNIDREEDTTTMGDSQILPLTSNRRQDYGMGLWELTRQFSRVATEAPHVALEILLAVIPEYIKKEHHPSATPVPVVFEDVQSTLTDDYSSIWDTGSEHDDFQKLLAAFQRAVEDISDLNVLRTLIAQLALARPYAAFWRRFLLAGVNKPKTVGYALRSLLRDHNILIGYDTTRKAGQLIGLIYLQLDISERHHIESTIMSIPDRVPENSPAAENIRDRLLGCIDIALLVTPQAVERRSALDQEGGPPANTPEFLATF